MKIRQMVPVAATVELQELLSDFTGPSAQQTQPFGSDTLEFCAEFSTALFRSPLTRSFPEIQALAFWMRRSELVRLKEQFDGLAIGRTMLVPRGIVFHVPPSNVDTIFIYSWLLSILVGNRNIVRLSTKQSAQTAAICRVLNQVIASSATDAIRCGTVMLSYGHDADVTRALSAISDVRVIWGGDQTVAAIRSLPLPPHARELTFSDRFSFAAVDARRYLALDDSNRRALAERFYNDAYWFDQMGCSSPRLLIWRGEAATVAEASAAFFGELRTVVSKKGYTLETGAALNKLVFSYRAVLDTPVSRYQALGNELTVLTRDEVTMLQRDHCGGGLFHEVRVDDLADIEAFVNRRDQTMSYFGFSAEELRDLGRRLNGRGVDRFVPIGQALAFNRFWDGLDLLQELTRRVYVEPEMRTIDQAMAMAS